MKIFFSVFAALIAAGAVFACVFLGWQKLQTWEQAKREAISFINQTDSAFSETMADADRNSIESLQSALRVAGRLSSKRGEAVDALITILEHKPFLPLNEDEKKLLQQLKEQKEEKGKTPKTSDTPAPESTPTTQAQAATKAETPQETYWSLKVTSPVELKDSLGRVVARLQQGQSVQYVGRDNYLVRIRYDGADYDIRISSTDLK